MSFSDKLKSLANDAKAKYDQHSPEIKDALSKAEAEARELAKKAEPEVKKGAQWTSEQAKSLASKAEAEFNELKTKSDSGETPGKGTDVSDETAG